MTGVSEEELRIDSQELTGMGQLVAGGVVRDRSEGIRPGWMAGSCEEIGGFRERGGKGLWRKVIVGFLGPCVCM